MKLKLCVKKTNSVFNAAVTCNDLIDSLFTKFSTLTLIINILANCIRFVSNCQKRMQNSDYRGVSSCLTPTPSKRKIATNFIIAYVQKLHFLDELQCLKNTKTLKKIQFPTLAIPIYRCRWVVTGGRTSSKCCNQL